MKPQTHAIGVVMHKDKQQPRKPPAIWQAVLNGCIAACYDFQLYKISRPILPDADPVIIRPSAFGLRAVFKRCAGVYNEG